MRGKLYWTLLAWEIYRHIHYPNQADGMIVTTDDGARYVIHFAK